MLFAVRSAGDIVYRTVAAHATSVPFDGAVIRVAGGVVVGRLVFGVTVRDWVASEAAAAGGVAVAGGAGLGVGGICDATIEGIAAAGSEPPGGAAAGGEALGRLTTMMIATTAATAIAVDTQISHHLRRTRAR